MIWDACFHWYSYDLTKKGELRGRLNDCEAPTLSLVLCFRYKFVFLRAQDDYSIVTDHEYHRRRRMQTFCIGAHAYRPWPGGKRLVAMGTMKQLDKDAPTQTTQMPVYLVTQNHIARHEYMYYHTKFRILFIN